MATSFGLAMIRFRITISLALTNNTKRVNAENALDRNRAQSIQNCLIDNGFTFDT